ncbi:MAG: ABC transporter ATP-binding protein [Lachnospiraceae bacterium]|nr:ABC transporter ATP-binding protein [Lachnospiraceae bacterium]
MKTVISNIARTFKDCFKAFPAFIILVVVLKLASVFTSILSMLKLAEILELVAGEGIEAEGLIERIIICGVCMAIPPVLTVFNQAFYSIADVKGEKYFGNQLCAFSKKIELSELENPEVLDRFKKAEATSFTSPHTGLRAHFYFIDRLSMIVTGLAGCIGAMLVVGGYSPVLVISGLIGIIPALVSKIYFEKLLTRIRRMQSNIKRRCDYLWSLFTNRESMKEMRVMGFGGYLKNKWEVVNTERVEELRKVRLDVGKKQVIGISVVNLFYALNIAVAVYLMVNGHISIGAFAACLSAFATYHTHMQGVIATVAETVSVYDGVADYYEYFTIPTETDGDVEYKAFEDKIVADNIYFRYSGSTRDALSGLSCEIKRGEHVVIVGENGSGKTTFSKLLTGAYLPSKGSIAYDNRKTEELSRKSLYDHISIVSQDFVHYNFTLGENIGISDLSRNDTNAMEKLVEAVAGEEFLAKFGGLDTQLGREFGGMELSGGEWQKVAIARGLWKQSDIIILDEPTSALDPLVEYDILSKFVEMIQDKTSVIISHRVGICRSADKIIVMKDGRMVECGKHEELLNMGGEYSHIWNEQAKWYA